MKAFRLLLIPLCLLACQRPDAVKSGFCEVSGGQKIYYEVSGAGTPVVLLHGHSLDTRMWDGQFPAFARKHRTVRLDFRGYGRSDEPQEGFQFTHMDDLLTLMDTLGIGRAHIVGLSMGGFIAGDLIAMHPERLLSCTMASGMIRNSPGPSEPMDSLESARRDAEIATLLKQGVDRMKQEWIDGLIAGGGSRRESIRPALEQMVGDWTAWQPLHKEPRLIVGRDAIRVLHERRPEVPALIILGGKDVERGSSTHPDMLNDLPNGRCEVLPDCGHMCNMEQPEAFNALVLGFIESVDNYQIPAIQ